MGEPALRSRVGGSPQLRRRQGLARAISAGLRQVQKRAVAVAATEGIRVALAAQVAVADELRAAGGRSRATTTMERVRD